MSAAVLVVFVDAFGPALRDRMRGLEALLPHRRSLGGVLGYSCGALPTILTGTPPSVHGRMCLFAHRAEQDDGLLTPLRWLGLLPRLVHERSGTRRLAGWLLRQAHHLTGYVALHRIPPATFEWLDMPERDDLFVTERIGGAATFLAAARAAGLSVYSSPWQRLEDHRWPEALEQIRRRAPDLAFLYSAELDGILHREGSGGPAVGPALDRLVERIGRASEAMAAGGRSVTTLVVGDHGMADVRRVVDPRPLLARLRGVRPFVDSTMLRLWGAPAELAVAERTIQQSDLGGRWLDVAGLQARAAPTAGARFGNAIHVLDEGTLFAPSFLGGAVKGMHGYDLDCPSAQAALSSSEPLPDDCRSLHDVARLVCARLSLPWQPAAKDLRS